MIYPGCHEKVYDSCHNEPLLRLLETLPPGQALDCGCGAGANARFLISRGWQVTAITISQQEAAAVSGGVASVLVHDLECGLPPGLRTEFTLIVLSHVLEHLRNPERLLADLKKVMVPGSHLAVALPNVLFWRERLRFLFGSFEYTNEGILDSTHVRFYTYASGRRLLEANGFTVARASAAGWVPLPIIRRLFPKFAGRMDQWALAGFPGVFGHQLLYLAKTID